jgi:hypothetical protein
VLVVVDEAGANGLPDFVGEGKDGEAFGGSGKADSPLRLGAISICVALGYRRAM